MTPPARVPAAERRIYVASMWGYPQGLLWHAAFIFIFWAVSAEVLAWVNVASVMMWAAAVGLLRAGRLRAAAYLAAFEVLGHAVLCVIYVGWDAGFQYYIIAVAALTFFAPIGPMAVKIAVSVCVALAYAGLHLVYAGAVPRIALTPWVLDLMYYGNTLSMFSIIALLAATYDLTTTRAEAALLAQKAKADEMAALLRKMFGRYLAPEVMSAMIENPSGLELGGERRAVTILMSDLRGFTALSERLSPEQVVRLLNTYFEVVVEIVLQHRGTVIEFAGDALLVVFGAPEAMPDRAERAVACAIEMQNAMRKVNANNRALGLPELAMGIGLNETEAVVGNVGSTRRSKYAVVGAGVNMASRIESYAVGGQVLASESVRAAVGDALRIDGQRDVLPKGAEGAVRIYEVGAIGRRFQRSLEAREDVPAPLARAVPVRIRLLEGKDAGTDAQDARIVALAKGGALLESAAVLNALDNVKLNLLDAGESVAARDFYGKVIESAEAGGALRAIRFTAVPPEVDAFLQAVRRYAATPD